MVAIMVAALLGAGFSTLVLAPFGIWAVLLGMPVMGSAAGLGCAVAVAVLADRRSNGANDDAEPAARLLPVDRG